MIELKTRLGPSPMVLTTDVQTFELADTVIEGIFPYALSLQADINYKLFSVIDLSSLVEVGLQ